MSLRDSIVEGIKSNKSTRRIILIATTIAGGVFTFWTFSNPELSKIFTAIIILMSLLVEVIVVLLEIKDQGLIVDRTFGDLRVLKENMVAHDIRLILDPGNTDAFDGISGEYTAFNAPMYFENANPESGLDVHVRRYTSKMFRTAKYYYPVFSEDSDFSKKWASNSFKFFSRLEKSLGDIQKGKITFFIPKNSTPLAEKDRITFFKGTKSRGNFLIYFHHSDLYLTKNAPDYMIITSNANISRRVDTIIVNAQEELEEKSYDDFLLYLKDKYDF